MEGLIPVVNTKQKGLYPPAQLKTNEQIRDITLLDKKDIDSVDIFVGQLTPEEPQSSRYIIVTKISHSAYFYQEAFRILNGYKRLWRASVDGQWSEWIIL